MKECKREYIINDLFVKDFITEEKQEMLLVESEETGKSELNVRLKSTGNLCIANVDQKKTDFLFFRNGKEMSLYKRVDHMIFECMEQNQWKLYLIEMKGSVGEKKWNVEAAFGTRTTGREKIFPARCCLCISAVILKPCRNPNRFPVSFPAV